MLTLEPHPRLAPLPDSPPELVSPSSSSYSSRPSPPADLQSWASSTTASTSPSMSTYDHSATSSVSSHGSKDVDEAEKSAPQAPRQQLPPISSLFGPPPSARPLFSPSSERPGSYPATSPLDRPRISPVHPDGPYPASFFSPFIPSLTAYEARFDHDRPALHSMTRSFSGSGSSDHRDSEQGRPETRSGAGLGGRWSLQQETGRHEYALGGRDASAPLRSPHERLPFPFSAGPDARSGGREQRSPTETAATPRRTSTSTAVAEGVPSKDGLGPKIWTGTHFLPRFVRAAEVPGEGMCYFYDDGSHCKTVIDGEAVNAHWGVTKAGKPRKRLAIACITCREKKIKCDPDYPRCVQCEKFGRVCKFKNAPRGGHSSSHGSSNNNTASSPPSADVDGVRRSGASSALTDGRRSGSDSSGSTSPRGSTVRQRSPEATSPPKRLRLGFDTYSPVGQESSQATGHPLDSRKSSLSWHQHRPIIELPRIHEGVLNRPWHVDSYASLLA
ncbi:hypothetical protein SODALDRAFT_332545 [Sodiomyces alkalinus F11]|uniref:Zn(2)-C6 fungal-type domain-containing protein n=1 Tax=Sodiomyces alkalinus (strain CBS 110278 / VKM F-3762 / F11) TaxID=1314773 RepID=A0A3N2PX63_SODAK|nr:hypothetical protein SODALDRAFT_332545 [Sodiomyces alkalinus F11]ROT39123.1 hypothetical protein SODALDRAFT_332545 [Sodiomyces alkalinus F11]